MGKRDGCLICGAPVSGLCGCLRVSLADAQSVLSGQSLVPSALGSLQGDGTAVHDPKRSQAASERKLLRSAAVLRCVEALGRRTSIRFAPCNDLRRFAQRAGITDGEAVLAVLRAFLPWGGSREWEPRGVVEVYRWMQSRVPTMRELSGGDLAAAAVDPRNRERKGRAMSLIADAEIVLSAWVERWNRNQDAATGEAA